jgi:hypothetical protein
MAKINLFVVVLAVGLGIWSAGQFGNVNHNPGEIDVPSMAGVSEVEQSRAFAEGYRDALALCTEEQAKIGARRTEVLKQAKQREGQDEASRTEPK